ncbi:MAG: DUF3883 domain-containing protein [Candidatus Caldatribacteriota bacterium]|jgi:hypothetical protein
MSYNPDLQFRCTIIRGKSISRMDDYLPIYAETLSEICPIPKTEFDSAFDKKLSFYIKDDEKTICNHRTENAGKLLGMYFEKDGIVYMSARTKKFLRDNDQPAFFKSICFSFQQPNGSQTIKTIRNKVNNNINIKPYHFVIALLKLAFNEGIKLKKREIGYYVLNSLEVLQGKVSVYEVLEEILNDRNKKIQKKISQPNKAYSYSFQHINEQFDYLELANLIRKDSTYIWLNLKESTAIDFFISDLNKPLHFDVYKYGLSDSKKLIQDWQEYYGQVSAIERKVFATNISSLDTTSQIETDTVLSEKKIPSTIELGDEGEDYVLELEKEIVKAFNPRLVNKVNYHGKMKGLGYDITSIEANRNRNNPEFSRYIEVKATKRVHPPNFTDTLDTINLTRNEWVAAEQHSEHFYIYRIYFTSKGTYVRIINNPVKKNNDGILYATPVIYRIEFGDKAVDEFIDPIK